MQTQRMVEFAEISWVDLAWVLVAGRKRAEIDDSGLFHLGAPAERLVWGEADSEVGGENTLRYHR